MIFKMESESQNETTFWKLRRDLDIAEKWLSYLDKKQGENYAIKNPDYLNPEMWYNEKFLPMNHVLGAFMYFRRIRDVLKKAIETGYISEDELPLEAPKYLEELAR